MSCIMKYFYVRHLAKNEGCGNVQSKTLDPRIDVNFFLILNVNLPSLKTEVVSLVINYTDGVGNLTRYHATSHNLILNWSSGDRSLPCIIIFTRGQVPASFMCSSLLFGLHTIDSHTWEPRIMTWPAPAVSVSWTTVIRNHDLKNCSTKPLRLVKPRHYILDEKTLSKHLNMNNLNSSLIFVGFEHHVIKCHTILLTVYSGLRKLTKSSQKKPWVTFT